MSRNVPLQVIQKLQRNPKLVRNICILAHVDHGKTTLADGLISSNGIISNRLAGEIRYMDNWEEEQKRGITMKSSSISLFFEDSTMITDEQTGEKKKKCTPYLINLVDSPGHIDFSSDVSAAVRLCDGCLVVVDAIEGVCTQTLTVLQQAFQEGVKPILIINKVDRLILHLKQTPMDAYTHIRNIIEKVNAYISSLYTAEVISNTATTSYVIDSEKEKELFVSPVTGTVLFASAAHGWCFSLRQFADLYGPLLGINKNKLVQYMWGDYVYKEKTKTVGTWTPASASPPMFVKMVLSNIWKVYKSVYKRNEEAIQTIMSIAGIQLTERELKTPDDNVLIKVIMSKWLPLYKAVLKSVVKILPSPVEAHAARYECIWDAGVRKELQSGDSNVLVPYKQSFMECNAEGPLMVYICKLFSIQGQDIQGYVCEKEKEYEIALCRSFSGTIHKDTPVYIIPCSGEKEVQPQLVQSPIQLFLLMGREIVAVNEVPAGNVFGILGLEGFIMKMGTVSNEAACPSLSSLRLASDPIVQIAVETEKPNDMPLLLEQLSILDKNDNSIKITQLKTGESIIHAVGELQLDMVIKELRKRLPTIQLVVSPPIINIKESCELLVPLEEDQEPRLPPAISLNHKLFAKMRVLPLPAELCLLLHNQRKLQQQLYDKIQSGETPTGEERLFLEEFEKLFLASPLIKKYYKHILAFGHEMIDTNILAINPDLQSSNWFEFNRYFNQYLAINLHQESVVVEKDEEEEKETYQGVEVTQHLCSLYHTGIVSGFKVACECGPLCGESMWGVLFILEDLFLSPTGRVTTPTESDEEEESADELVNEMKETPFTPDLLKEYTQSVHGGSIISFMKQLCHQAYLQSSPRIAEPMYKCILQCSNEHLGKLYSVLNQRRGEIQNEDIWEGTDIFTITCILPVTESLGLANDLRQQTSGAVNQPQLQFSHWQILDEDPFSKPTTEDEIEEWGDSFATRNRAKQIIDSIRKRKGMQTDEKIVENAEKQRTMKSK